MTKRYVYAMKIETTNDSSGNPRRGWLIYGAGQGTLLGFADEDYDGRSQVFARVEQTLQADRPLNGLIEVIELGIVNVPVKEYQTARKHRQL